MGLFPSNWKKKSHKTFFSLKRKSTSHLSLVSPCRREPCCSTPLSIKLAVKPTRYPFVYSISHHWTMFITDIPLLSTNLITFKDFLRLLSEQKHRVPHPSFHQINRDWNLTTLFMPSSTSFHSCSKSNYRRRRLFFPGETETNNTINLSHIRLFPTTSFINNLYLSLSTSLEQLITTSTQQPNNLAMTLRVPFPTNCQQLSNIATCWQHLRNSEHVRFVVFFILYFIFRICLC